MVCRCLSKKTVNVESFLSRVRFVMAAVRRNTTQENHTAHESRTEAAENAEKNTSPTKDKTKRVWTQNSTAGDVTPNTVNTGFDASRSTDEEKRIYFCHKLACERGESVYTDPVTEYSVLTETFLRQRGTCCGNGCRHCPYGHVSVPQALRTKWFNGAFYI